MTRSRDVADTQDNTGGSVPPFTAGKNKIINGDFGIWQRGTSFTSNAYSADRWVSSSDATFTASQQSFTAGTAPVAGYENQFFLRMAKNSGGTYATQAQKIENVRTFANSTVTLSLWAKADAAETLTVNLNQNFGSGGSAQVNLTAQTAAITTSWARYSFTFSVPSISSKTIGTSSYLNTDIYVVTTGARTFDIWGVQLEAGSVATPFQTATGTIQGELAACQRYYWRSSPGGAYSVPAPSGFVDSSTNVITFTPLPVAMRVAPTSIEWSTLQYFDASNAGATPSAIALNTARTTTTILSTDVTITGGTAGRFAYLRANNSTAAYLAASAEL